MNVKAGKMEISRRARFILWAPCWGSAIIGEVQRQHGCIIHAAVSVAETKGDGLRDWGKAVNYTE